MSMVKTIKPLPSVDRPPVDPRARALALLSVLLLGLFFGGSYLLYRRSLSSAASIAGLGLQESAAGSLTAAELDLVIRWEAKRYADGELGLMAGNTVAMRVKRGDLGVRVDVEQTRRRLLAAGKSGSFLSDLVRRIRARRGKLSLKLATSLDRDRALEFFTGLKEQLDREPVPSKLDLERQVVVPGSNGYLLRVYDCLTAAELAVRRDLSEVRLAVTVRRPEQKGGTRMDQVDIRHVLGNFTTAYSLQEKDKDRGFNLKVGASKLDGTVLAPGETFSFNKLVGARTKAEGYRMAPVISEGELVDGMAGGACQLSSTLFAASFFAGLELTSSRPHTRPSSYIKMGLDAAVAYPTTDLVLKNPYPFPVVLHYKVNQGKVQVRILGKKRPWSKVVFQRIVKETTPFSEVVRNDPTVPAGQSVISQIGVPGFLLERRRLFFKGGKEPVKTESRELRYPATTQYRVKGTGPAGLKWDPPKPKEPFGEVAPDYSMEQ